MRISDWSSDVCASDRGPSETAPMKVHAVLQTGEAATIGTGLAVELDGASIGQDQPRPGEQDAGLPGANLSVIVPDQPRAPRDQDRTSVGEGKRGGVSVDNGGTSINKTKKKQTR